jgi:hypothetical protein
MGWTFEIRKVHSVETGQYVVVQDNAYLVSIGTLLAVVGKLPVPKHSKLGRISEYISTSVFEYLLKHTSCNSLGREARGC